MLEEIRGTCSSSWQSSRNDPRFSEDRFLHGVLSATPLTCSLRRDDLRFVVFCFAKPEDPKCFAERTASSMSL
jgi:hypothetical protein